MAKRKKQPERINKLTCTVTINGKVIEDSDLHNYVITNKNVIDRIKKANERANTNHTDK